MTWSIEDSYLETHGSFVALARDLSSPEWATAVPCCPGWTVRDVLSHVAGIPDDAMAGRMDGVATPPWTASQVERNRDLAVDELLDRWVLQAPGFAAAIAAAGQARPPIDCLTHEHDIRHALDRPGGRDLQIVERTARVLIEPMSGPFSLTIELTEGSAIRGGDGPGGPIMLREVSAFEVVRSRLGRRSRAQVEAYSWSGPRRHVAEMIDRWFAFGPSLTDIDEK